MRATLYQHPLAHVVFDKPFDPREQDVLGRDPVSVKAAIDENNRQRNEYRRLTGRPIDFVPYPPSVRAAANEELQRLEGIETVHRLIAQYGADRVAKWVANAAALQGQPIEGV